MKQTKGMVSAGSASVYGSCGRNLCGQHSEGKEKGTDCGSSGVRSAEKRE